MSEFGMDSIKRNGMVNLGKDKFCQNWKKKMPPTKDNIPAQSPMGRSTPFEDNRDDGFNWARYDEDGPGARSRS